MDKISATKAFYIKLGRQGEFESECLSNPGFARVGWTKVDLNLLNCEPDKIDWEAIKTWLVEEKKYKSKGMATNQTNQLKVFYTSEPDVLWITFYENHLYWCFLNPNVKVREDKTKLRHTQDGWYNTDINGKPLTFDRLSGSLLRSQAYRQTICPVKEDINYLLKKINGETLEEERSVEKAKTELSQSLEAIIHHLHWKEFELLTDLIFRQAGWQRVSEVGELQKDIDLALCSPIIDQKIYVQIKSEAGIPEFNKFTKLAKKDPQNQYFFIVHKPTIEVKVAPSYPNVKTWFVGDVARLVVNYGLMDWLVSKAR